MKFYDWMTQIPTPITGVALALASLGWVVAGQVSLLIGLQYATAALAATVVFLVIVKYLLKPSLLAADIQHPVIGSVIPTAAMAAQVVSVSVADFAPAFASIIWGAATICHLILLAFFTYYRTKNFSINHMVPGWFVPPVGIVVAPLTCPDPAFVTFALALLAFGAVSYLALLPVMIYRLIYHPDIEPKVLPVTGILAAPPNLTLAGYLNIVSEPSIFVVLPLLTLSLLMTVVVYLAMPKLLKRPFSPAFAGLTFPLVIGASAILKASVWFAQHSATISSSLYIIGLFELVVAFIIVSYIVYLYRRHLMLCWKSLTKTVPVTHEVVPRQHTC